VCVCVCVQAKDERNYHIFYEMLAGLPTHMKRAFYLQEAETYYYLNQVHADIYKCKKMKNEKTIQMKKTVLSKTILTDPRLLNSSVYSIPSII